MIVLLFIKLFIVPLKFKFILFSVLVFSVWYCFIFSSKKSFFYEINSLFIILLLFSVLYFIYNYFNLICNLFFNLFVLFLRLLALIILYNLYFFSILICISLSKFYFHFFYFNVVSFSSFFSFCLLTCSFFVFSFIFPVICNWILISFISFSNILLFNNFFYY